MGLTVSHIPTELLYKIISHLPPTTLFPIKGVCRKFTTIPTRNSFRSLYKGPEESEFDTPFLVVSSNHDIHDASTSNARGVPGVESGLFSLRVSESACEWQHFPASILLPPVQDAPLKLISSEAGLILIGQQSKGSDDFETLSVINPLTKSNRRIPPTQKRGYRARQLVLDYREQGRYMIIAEQTRSVSEQNRTTELKLLIYDSSTDDWSWFGSLTTSVLCALQFRRAALLNDTLYCLGVTRETACMFQFDSLKGWRESNPKVPTCAYPQKSSSGWMQPPGPSVCKPYLFRHQRHLMLVGATLDKYGTKSRWDDRRWDDDDMEEMESVEEGVHVWKLDDNQSVWQYCASMRMPKALFNNCAKTYEFLSSEHFLFVNEVVEGPVGSHRRFRCVLSTGEWHVLPSTESEMCHNNGHGFIVYQPRIDTVC